MYLVDGTVVTSASDLKKASECEFAFLRALDAKLGRIEPVPDPEDAMLERSGRMGDEHEHRVLEAYRAELGSAVVEIERPDVRDAAAVRAAVEATLAAFAAGAPVVFQATFADEGFIGFADFIVRQPDGRYLVQDSKLARRARVTALLQLAAYAEQLQRVGVPCADTVELLLGDGSTSVHRLDDIAPVYRLRRARLEQIVAERLADDGPVAWGDPRYELDGRCPTCDLEVQAHRDVLLVAGLRTTQRAALLEAGVDTIDALAASEGPVPGILDATIENLRIQARLQLEAEAAAAVADASGLRSPDDPPLPPPVVVRDAVSLAAIPEPDPGDLFFDFEGDPLYTEGAATDWGLDYLFGMVDTDERFTPLWAHSFAEERVALEQFLALVAARRSAHPNMHIYHYASYERTHLLTIASRHGVGEAAVDQLLADGVLVDLYPIVKRAVRVGSRSYSIKKLEPLYMGTELREAEVKSGGDSILEYVRARELLATGQLDPATGLVGAAAAQHVLDDLADYNRYDCVSTLRLRDWLLGIAREAGVEPVPESLLVEAAKAAGKVYEASPLAIELQRLAGPPDDPDRDADHTALALAAAAIDYHDREAKSFWWSHFFRVEQPLESWEDHRDVLVVDPATSAVVQRWYREDQHRVDRRELLLRGRVAPGRDSAWAASSSCSTTPPRRSRGRACARAPAPRTPCGCSRCSTTAWSSRSARSPGSRGPSSPWPSCPAPRRRRAGSARRSSSGRRSSRASTRSRGRGTRRSTCCAASRRARATARPASRRSPPTTTTSEPSCPRCGRSTTPTSPCRAHPAPARPTSHRTRSPGSSPSTGGASASSRSPTPSSRTCSTPSSAPGSTPTSWPRRRKTHASRATTGTRSSRKTASPSTRPSTRHPDSSWAAPRGTSRTPTACPAGRSTCS